VTEDLLAIAREALGAYDVEVRDCAFAAEAFNTVFRVAAADGAAFALRVGAALRIHADGCEALETSWVSRLHGAGLPVAHPVAARDGATVVDAGGRRCVLFDWVHGLSLREHATPEQVHAAGAALAAVHAHGADRGEPKPVGALAGDRVLSFVVPNRLDELVPRFGAGIVDAVDRAQDALDALWRELPHPPRLLHGDVTPSNVIADDGGVTLIDFQDLFWGFEIQDVTIALVALPFGEAFRAGYETVRPWPEASGETVAALRAARHLNVLNFGLSVRKPGLDEFIARQAGPIIEWMEG
jgi:Ser/Thr protein kinase RdoA (MazF antagonist)